MSIVRLVFEGDINSDCIFTGCFLGPLHGGSQTQIKGSLPTPSEHLYLRLVKGIYMVNIQSPEKDKIRTASCVDVGIQSNSQ